MSAFLSAFTSLVSFTALSALTALSAFTLGALCACAFLVFFSSLLASTFLSAARTTLASLGAFATAAVSIEELLLLD